MIMIYLCLSYPVLCQTLISESNGDYGFTGLLLGDNNPYPSDSLDTEMARIYYDVSFHGEKEISGVWLLQVGANTTRFLPECRYQADSLLRAGKKYRTFDYYKKGDPFHCFDSYHISNNICRFTCRFGADDFLYEEDIPSISWQLLDSVAHICGHHCKEAVGTFRGRTYHVFYAEDIPVSSGPWKLSGLPGLILYAEADDGIFIFQAKEVLPSTGAPIMWTKYPYIEVSRKQYMNMLKQFQRHYGSFFGAHLSRTQITYKSNNRPNLRWVENLETE